VPGVSVLHEYRGRVGAGGLRRINEHLLAPLLGSLFRQLWSVGLTDATDLPAACVGFKRSTGQYSGVHAALGGRTLKIGQSRCFVGSTKHTRRLWLHHRVVLQQVRPWIKPAQSFEKNQLGLRDVLLNSLGYKWVISLLADAAVFFRARALAGHPVIRPLLADLMPFQPSLELEGEDSTVKVTRAKRKSS
jgi:hypothetical protein